MRRGALVALVVTAFLGRSHTVRADVASFTGIGIDEALLGDPVLAAAMGSAQAGAMHPPFFVRLLIAPEDLHDSDGRFRFTSLDTRVEVYAARKIPVMLAFVGIPAQGEQAERWRQLLKATADRYRGRVTGYQIGETTPAGGETSPREYAFLLKLAAVQIRSVDPQAVIVAATLGHDELGRQRSLYGEGVSAYVDVVAVSPAASVGSQTERALAPIQALINAEDPTATLLVTGVPLGSDPAEAARRWLAAQFAFTDHKPLASTFSGGVAGVTAVLSAASALEDMMSGEMILLDEKTAGLSLTVDGRDVTETLRHRLLYNLGTFNTYLVYWGPDGADSDVQVALTDPAGRRPAVRDPSNGRVEQAADFAWEASSKTSRLTAPLVDRPLVIDFNPGASEVYVDRADIVQRAQLSVDEIIFRYQQTQSAQDALYSAYIADARMEQHFHPSPTDSVDIVSDNRFYFSGEHVEWEELSFSVNGAKWGADRPAFPLLQPEKVLSLPLDLRLDNDYTYRLEGTERVGNHTCYAVRFEPATQSRSLYRGKVWIDTRTFVRIKVQAVQTRLSAPVVSSEETQYFDPVAEVGGQPLYLFARLTSKQIFLIAGRNLLVEKQVKFSSFKVDAPEFGEARAAARASNHIMFRETDQGLRYLIKKGEERIVSDRPTTSAMALAMGTTLDPSFDFPLPILGINYLDFDFLDNKDTQLALLFGGVLALGNIQRPRLLHTPLDASVDFFAIAVPSNDQVFDRDGERRDERVLNIPFSTGVNLGYQFTDFQKISLNYLFRYDAYFKDRQTAEEFVEPSSTATNGLGLAYDFKRGGYSLTGTASLFGRTNWRSWGRLGDFAERDRTYAKVGLSLSKDFFLSAFQKVHVNGAYFGGTRLDRFSMYQFGLFDETRMHGVPAAGVRFAELAMARGSYSFNIFEQYRLDLFVDQAFGRDPEDRHRWLPVTGTGVAVNLRAPWNTMFRADVGKSFLPRLYSGSGSVVLQILVLKPL